MTAMYRIVAGVDGSEGGRHALAWAIQEAAARGGAVRAVIAWSWDGVEIGPVVTTTPAVAENRARRILQHDVDAVAARPGPLPPIAADAVHGSPADVLTQAAEEADLLVLGSHGHSHVRHSVLGSVSEACIRRATCPVVVIPVGAPHPEHQAPDVLLPQ
jgi:nucleotide-binding universal stress UspA family protein